MRKKDAMEEIAQILGDFMSEGRITRKKFAYVSREETIALCEFLRNPGERMDLRVERPIRDGESSRLRKYRKGLISTCVSGGRGRFQILIWYLIIF